MKRSEVTAAAPALLLTVLLGACGGHAAPAGTDATADVDDAARGSSTVVHLAAEQARRLDVDAQPAVPVTYHGFHDGFAVVWSHEPLAQLAAELTTAQAATRQSRAALDRTRGLAGTTGALAAEVSESAERQAAADAAALQLAEHKWSALLGAPLTQSGARGHLGDLASGALKLVRVTFPLGSAPPSTPRTIELRSLDGGAKPPLWTAHRLWPAPADAAVPGLSFWAMLSGPVEGDRLLARAHDEPGHAGALVPAAALVVAEGRYWCFIESAPNTFQRVAISIDQPVEGGYAVDGAVAPGDRIVVRGAGLLLARALGHSGADE